LKERLQRQEDEKGDVSSCWRTLRKQEDTGNLKEEAQDRIPWRAQFGRGYGPVARQTILDWTEQEASFGIDVSEA
jgi:hypothetical protein